MLISIFDRIISIFIIILIFPFLLIISVLLFFTGEGEIIYKQKRVGLNMRFINIYKFATMLKNSPSIGAGEITKLNDDRVLPVGHFLRRTKINELPQFFNVLTGDLSLVGPRPLTENTFSFYSKEGQMIISGIKPGITGISSLFFRNEENLFNNKIESPSEYYRIYISPVKEKLEIWYIENQSLMLNINILILTIWIIVTNRSKDIFYILNIPRHIYFTDANSKD